MSYYIPDHEENDYEILDYVRELAYKINPEYNEEGVQCGHGGWPADFYNRMMHGRLKLPFTHEAFEDDLYIIGTLEGYKLDLDKFWVALLFIYDLTMDKTINVALLDPQYKVLSELYDFLESHPNAHLFLSDYKDSPKDETFESNSPMLFGALRKFTNDQLLYLEQHPEEKNWVVMGANQQNYTEQLSASHQKLYFYRQFKTLFDALRLPNLRTKKNSSISFSKDLLISRLLYLCRLADVKFYDDAEPLKSVIKQYADFEFSVQSKIYW